MKGVWDIKERWRKIRAEKEMMDIREIKRNLNGTEGKKEVREETCIEGIVEGGVMRGCGSILGYHRPDE